jgi:hypothetical protein
MSLKFKKLNGAEMHTFLKTRLGLSHDFTEFGPKFVLN